MQEELLCLVSFRGILRGNFCTAKPIRDAVMQLDISKEVADTEKKNQNHT